MLRQYLASHPEPLEIVTSALPDVDQPTKSEPPPTPVHNLLTPLNGSTPSRPASPTKDQGTPAPTKTPLVASLATTRTPTPMSIPPNRMKPPQTTREMLSHIAWLSEEIQRASEEKVNLAQAAYDSVRPPPPPQHRSLYSYLSQVDRHIRLLDQSVKEHEASISLGVRPGTHLAPILLPELIVPGSRAARAVVHGPAAPAPEDDGGGLTLGMVGGDEDDEVHPQRRGRATKKGRGRKKEDTVLILEAEQAGSRNRSKNRNRSRGTVRSLRLNGPAPKEQIPPPPDEERYCYCNQVSFGEVRGLFDNVFVPTIMFYRWLRAITTTANENG
jgi:hypothetical protein